VRVLPQTNALTAECGVTAQHAISSALPPHGRRSVTMDNGTEIYRHHELKVRWGYEHVLRCPLHRIATQKPTNTTMVGTDATYPHVPTSEP